MTVSVFKKKKNSEAKFPKPEFFGLMQMPILYLVINDERNRRKPVLIFPSMRLSAKSKNPSFSNSHHRKTCVFLKADMAKVTKKMILDICFTRQVAMLFLLFCRYILLLSL